MIRFGPAGLGPVKEAENNLIPKNKHNTLKNSQLFRKKNFNKQFDQFYFFLL